MSAVVRKFGNEKSPNNLLNDQSFQEHIWHIQRCLEQLLVTVHMSTSSSPHIPAKMNKNIAFKMQLLRSVE